MRVRHPEYRAGQHLVVCDRCGFTRWSDEVKKEWSGAVVCADTCFETRHPQDFVRARADKQRVDDARPYPTDSFVSVPSVSYEPAAAGAASYLYLPRLKNNYAHTAAVPAPIGDLDLIVRLALDDWAPSATATIVCNAQTSSSNTSFMVRVTAPSGGMDMWWSTTGAGYQATASSTADLAFSAGEVKWLRWTLDVNNGSGNSVARFYYGDDGTNWSQLGADATGAVTSIYDSTARLFLGGAVSAAGVVDSNPMGGSLYYFALRDAIGGDAMLTFDPATDADDTDDLSWSSSVTGETWTIEQAYTDPAELR